MPKMNVSEGFCGRNMKQELPEYLNDGEIQDSYCSKKFSMSNYLWKSIQPLISFKTSTNLERKRGSFSYTNI